MDSVKVILDSINILIKSDTLQIKTILPKQNNEYLEYFQIIFPIISTLGGVYLGYILNKWNEKRKENNDKLESFYEELINHYNGQDNYYILFNKYTKLDKKRKSYFREIVDINKKTPDERNKILFKLIKDNK